MFYRYSTYYILIAAGVRARVYIRSIHGIGSTVGLVISLCEYTYGSCMVPVCSIAVHEGHPLGAGGEPL